jgi:hypothetical protein
VAAAGDGHEFQARIGRDGGDVLVPRDLADADDADPDDAHAVSSRTLCGPIILQMSAVKRKFPIVHKLGVHLEL